MKRIYDDPNHWAYGPVRRCWLMLALMCPDLDLLDTVYTQEWGYTWDKSLALQLQDGSEAQALRTIVQRCLDLYPD